MSEILFLLIGFGIGWLVTFHLFYGELKQMTIDEIRDALAEMQEIERQWDMARQAQDDEEYEKKVTSLDRAMDYSTHDS